MAKVLLLSSTTMQIVLILWFCAKTIGKGTSNEDNDIVEDPLANTISQNTNNNNTTMLVFDEAAAATKRTLSRGKRYVAFPVGSSLSAAICLTTGVIGNPNVNYLSMGLNWGVAYDLPNITWVLNQAHGFGSSKNKAVAEAQIKRRHRREIYGRLETLLGSMGYNGRECVLRTLCESRQYFQRTKMGMIGEMLRVVFSLPKQRIYTRELHEHADIVDYDHAYRKAREVDCEQRYNCHFSLLELALGKYSAAATDYYSEAGSIVANNNNNNKAH